MAKSIKPIIFMFLLGMLFVQCTDEDVLDLDNPNVHVFVQMIKTNSYSQENAQGIVEAPKFKKGDIPELLKYAKDVTTPVRGFPVNPIAAEKAEYYYLSQCLLWTIERVRIGNYPSLTPRLFKLQKDAEYPNEVTSPEEIMKVWELYSEWWKKVENEPSESSVGHYLLDPLEDSPYSWQNGI